MLEDGGETGGGHLATWLGVTKVGVGREGIGKRICLSQLHWRGLEWGWGVSQERGRGAGGYVGRQALTKSRSM